MKITDPKIKLKSALIAFSFIAACNTSFAEKSTEDLVENSIRTLSSVNKITSLMDNQNELSRLALDEPFSPHDAAIVFKQPKTAAQLLAWAETNEFTLINLEAKFPIDDLVFKARFQDLESLGGSLEDKMDYLKRRHDEAVTNIIKEKELKLSRANLSSKTRSSSIKALNDYKVLQRKPVQYIQAEVVGNLQDLDILKSTPDIAVVLLQEDKSEQRNINSTLQKRDLKNTAPLIDAVRGNNKSESENTFSILDGLFPDLNLNKHKISNTLQSLVTFSSQALAAPSICGGSAAPETNCPGDRFWLPPKEDAEMTTLINVYGGESPWMEGYFYSTFEWDTVIDPAYNLRQNTMAFKATNTPHCNPEITGVSAPCGGNTPEEDVTYVPQPTYEHEGIIENWSCSSTRTGTHIDRFYNCLTPSYALSVLPNWYFDTTFSDAWLELNASIGSLSPETVIEGSEYYTYVYFWAYGNENFTGRKVTMTGQIGTEYPFPVAPSFRVFSVDTTKIDYTYLLPLY